MNEILKLIIISLTTFAGAIIGGSSVIYVFNRLPAKWLCDYGEEPSSELLDRAIARIKPRPWKLVFIALFFAMGMYAIFFGKHEPIHAVPVMMCVWLLLMIAIADAKYMIIPDQFVVFLILMVAGFLPFGIDIKDAIFGGLIGAGAMLLVAVLGYFISGRESLGFGDVKLMAAIGMISGFYGAIGIMAVASVVSGIWFMIGILRRKTKKDDMKPLGPFLAGTAIVYLLVF